MPEFSKGQWVKIKNGALEGLVGQVLIRKPEGQLLLAISGVLPFQGVSVLICETRCEVVAQWLSGGEGGNWSEINPSSLN
jgi:hypothetical protein